MIRAIIIDDEKHCIERLSDLLKENFANQVHLMESFNTVEDGIKAIEKLRPDLVFLDVQIHNKTGFDLLRHFDKIFFRVIFTTAFDKYAVQAFRFSAADYLLKPVDPEELKQAVGKLSLGTGTNTVSDTVLHLLNNIRETQIASKKIGIPVITGLVFIQVSEIIRCQSDINYTTFFLKDKQKLLVAKTLKEYEEILNDYHFFRVHNSHLINLAYIKSYHKGKGGSVTMTDGSEIEISTRRKDDFLKKMAEL
ncbi:MAG: response regulator transcription factor [Chitinophagaceae bacterium]|nr:response regulator transcription factor [Chitinophagaceae bacterium]